MTTKFELPTDVRFSEICPLNLVFQEVSVRGQKVNYVQVVVTEIGAGHDVTDTYEFASWKEMKKAYPALIDFLHELSINDNWSCSWRLNDRIYLIETSVGHEGLYELNSTVWFDNLEKMNTEKKKDSDTKGKKKKTKGF